MFQLYIKSNAMSKNILLDTKFFFTEKICFSFAVIKFLPCSCAIYQQFGIRALLLEGYVSWVNPEMETETTFSHVAPPIFDGDNYQA